MEIERLLNTEATNVTPMISTSRLEEMARVALSHTQKPPFSIMEKLRSAVDSSPMWQRGLGIAACLALLFTVAPLPSLSPTPSGIGSAELAAVAPDALSGDANDYEDLSDFMVLATLDDL